MGFRSILSSAFPFIYEVTIGSHMVRENTRDQPRKPGFRGRVFVVFKLKTGRQESTRDKYLISKDNFPHLLPLPVAGQGIYQPRRVMLFDFRKASDLVLPEIVNIITNSQGPNFEPCVTPAGTSFHSEKQSLLHSPRFVRKSIVQYMMPDGFRDVICCELILRLSVMIHGRNESRKPITDGKCLKGMDER
jgi:hypothetical protein